LIPVMIIPVLNKYDLLERMIASIDYPIDELLIIDNGGGAGEYQNNNIGKIRVLRMPSNLGVPASWNLGIKLYPFAPYWVISSNDVVFEKGTLAILDKALDPDKLTLTKAFPHYQTFAIGENIIEKVGLFDEGLYPIFFEDNDFHQRVQHHGLTIEKIVLPHHHEQSASVRFDERLVERNKQTFQDNAHYYHNKTLNEDYSEGGWKLSRRRKNDWGV
jgi:GT2 family glycosyltransferase